MASMAAKIGLAAALVVPSIMATGMLDQATVDGDAIAGLVFIVPLVFLYAMPTIVARSRGHHNATAIGVLNLALGWTGLGWIAALVWACTSPPPPRAA